jgi:hypothetical protein
MHRLSLGVVVVTIVSLFASGCQGLSPPWWVLHGRLVHALGVDPTWMTVGPLRSSSSSSSSSPSDSSSSYSVDVRANATVVPKGTAQALATLLNRCGPYQFGSVMVNVSVQLGDDPPLAPEPFPIDPDMAADLVKTALTGHPLFVDLVKSPRLRPNDTDSAAQRLPVPPVRDSRRHPSFPRPLAFVIEWEAFVVQLYSDNLRDPYGNLNEPASDSFSAILQLSSSSCTGLGPVIWFGATTTRRRQ